MSGSRRDRRAHQRHRGTRMAEKWTPGGRGCQKYGRLSREAAYFLDASRLWNKMEGDALRRQHPRIVNTQVDGLLETGKPMKSGSGREEPGPSERPRDKGSRKKDERRT